jgi:hypothetical protein
MSNESVQSAPPAGSETSNANGYHAGEPAGEVPSSSNGSATAHTPVDRAERLVEQVAENVSAFTARWGRRAWSVVSRVREEAEDMWSEAQSIRRGDQK